MFLIGLDASALCTADVPVREAASGQGPDAALHFGKLWAASALVLRLAVIVDRNGGARPVPMGRWSAIRGTMGFSDYWFVGGYPGGKTPVPIFLKPGLPVRLFTGRGPFCSPCSW